MENIKEDAAKQLPDKSNEAPKLTYAQMISYCNPLVLNITHQSGYAALFMLAASCMWFQSPQGACWAVLSGGAGYMSNTGTLWGNRKFAQGFAWVSFFFFALGVLALMCKF